MNLAEKFQISYENLKLKSLVNAILNEKQFKLKLGIKPLDRMGNPITKGTCKMRFPFRVSSILQACIL